MLNNEKLQDAMDKFWDENFRRDNQLKVKRELAEKNTEPFNWQKCSEDDGVDYSGAGATTGYVGTAGWLSPGTGEDALAPDNYKFGDFKNLPKDYDPILSNGDFTNTRHGNRFVDPNNMIESAEHIEEMKSDYFYKDMKKLRKAYKFIKKFIKRWE